VRHIFKRQPTSATVGSQGSREFSSIQAVIAVSLVPAFHGNDRLGGFYFPSWPSKRREAIEKAHMPSSHGPLTHWQSSCHGTKTTTKTHAQRSRQRGPPNSGGQQARQSAIPAMRVKSVERFITAPSAAMPTTILPPGASLPRWCARECMGTRPAQNSLIPVVIDDQHSAATG
jgi:hypothetical protein